MSDIIERYRTDHAPLIEVAGRRLYEARTALDSYQDHRQVIGLLLDATDDMHALLCSLARQSRVLSDWAADYPAGEGGEGGE